ncbi:hypothetical protein GGQ84_001008 [Desulfitispora alkaliphila]
MKNRAREFKANLTGELLNNVLGRGDIMKVNINLLPNTYFQM